MPPKHQPKCKICVRNITAIRDRGITCAHCQEWFHQTCSGLSLEKFNKLHKDPAPQWVCQTCAKANKGRRSSFIVPTSPAPPTLSVSTSSAVDSENLIKNCITRLETIEKLLSEEKEKVNRLNSIIEDLQNQLKSPHSQSPHPSPSSLLFEKFLEIQNLPLHSLVNPTATAINIGIAIECEIAESDVVCSTCNESKAVLRLEFHSLTKREEFLRAGKKFNREGKRFEINSQRFKIFVNERLSPEQKRLHYKAVTTLKSRGFKFCWWCNGDLYIKQSEFHTPILIKDEQCLDRYFSESLLPECERVVHQNQPGSSGGNQA
jgi:hypothetical protein